MARRRLDEKLMTKLAGKLGKSKLSDINKVVSAYATRNKISSEAALVRLAHNYGIGASRYLRSLDSAKQAEVRQQPNVLPLPAPRTAKKGGPKTQAQRASLRATAEYLIQDAELQERCIDIL